MIRLLKQTASSVVHLFLTPTDEEKDSFRIIPFVAIIFLMLSFVAGFVYIAIISHR
jgi:hypothetical protein